MAKPNKSVTRFVRIEPVTCATLLTALGAVITTWATGEKSAAIVTGIVAVCNFIARSLVTPLAKPNLGPVGERAYTTGEGAPQYTHEGPGE